MFQQLLFPENLKNYVITDTQLISFIWREREHSLQNTTRQKTHLLNFYEISTTIFLLLH